MSDSRAALPRPAGDPARHLPFAELEAGLLRLSPPADDGRLVLLCARAEDGVRETPPRALLTPEGGMPGDRWGRQDTHRPEIQLAVMRADFAGLIANGQAITLAGDNLFVALDLSEKKLPAGSRLRIGGATFEVTPEPHTGCKQFHQRFGADALRLTADARYRHLRLRGIYFRVVQAGEVAAGDAIELLRRGPEAGSAPRGGPGRMSVKRGGCFVTDETRAPKNEPPGFYAGGGLNVETYDARLHAGDAMIAGDVAFYRQEAARTGGPVLDLGCGTGRVTLALAVEGHRVIGLDLSLPMLARARARADALDPEAGLPPVFLAGDMRAFRLRARFGLVVLPFRVFQALLTPEDQQACLACIRAHLAPEGRAIISMFDPLLECCIPGAATDPEPDCCPHPETGHEVTAVVLHRRNDPLRQVLVEDWRFVERAPDGRIVREETERLRMRWTYRYEARYLFERCGFVVEAEYGDYFRAPQAYGAEQIWVLRLPG